MKNIPILVTGASGFVGSYLCRYLVRQGYTQVYGLKRSTSRLDLLGDVAPFIQWIDADVRDVGDLLEAVTGKEWVFHCAAVVSFQPSQRSVMQDVNVCGTENVVNACMQAGVSKLLHVSSIAAIGKKEKDTPSTEQDKWSPEGFYSKYSLSKYQAEQEVWRGIYEGLPAVILNPSVILGAGFWEEGTAKLFKTAWNEFRFYTQGSTGFVDVRDVARYALALMESDKKGLRIILNGENTSWRSIFTTMAQFFQKKEPSIFVSSTVQEIFWRLEKIRTLFTRSQPLITRETAKAATSHRAYSNQESLNTLPDFRYTPIKQTIQETCDVFQKTHPKGKSFGILPLID